MTTEIKEAISSELESIRDIAEDETAGKQVLKDQLEKANELHKVIEDFYERAYTLCSDIEGWIEES